MRRSSMERAEQLVGVLDEHVGRVQTLGPAVAANESIASGFGAAGYGRLESNLGRENETAGEDAVLAVVASQWSARGGIV